MLDPFTPSFFRQLQQLKIRTRRAFLGTRQGGHTSLRKGHGLEFSDFKLYTPGDDVRHVDWGAFARTERVYVREFREEQEINVAVLIDTSASMAFPEEQSKFNTARSLGLALGYIALTDGDSVTFSLLGKKNSPRFSGPRSVRQAAKELSGVEPEGVFDMPAEVRAALARHRIPGKCFFISDFLFPLEEQFTCLDYLRSRNFEICVLQILSPAEVRLEVSGPHTVIDAETGETLELSLDKTSQQEYARALASHIHALEQYCAKSGITHVLLVSDETVQELVIRKLPLAGVLQ